jgi:hypothetical protein
MLEQAQLTGIVGVYCVQLGRLVESRRVHIRRRYHTADFSRGVSIPAVEYADHTAASGVYIENFE